MKRDELSALRERVEKADGRSKSDQLIDRIAVSPDMTAKFWAKVDMGPIDQCWNWKGFTFAAAPRRLPYGIWRPVKGCAVRAHRLAFVLTNGPVPEGMCVCHSCDNPSCCNPSHLWLGTVTDNNKDRSRKGRTLRGPREHEHFSEMRGERHLQAKLTEDDVRRIRQDHRSLSLIAGDYGIDRSTVGRIKRRVLWKHI